MVDIRAVDEVEIQGSGNREAAREASEEVVLLGGH